MFEMEDEPAPELEKALSLTLAGKLLSGNRPSLSNLTYFASKQWDCTNKLKVYDHGQGLYTFEFVSEADVLKAMSGGPWFIDGKLLLLQRINPFLSLSQLGFDTTKLWVRCYNLPPKVFNIKFAKALGDMLGTFCDVDMLEEDGDKQLVSRVPTIRKFLRIKVLLRLDVPLKRTQCFRLKNNMANRMEEITINLAYERLPAFCYRCGVIGHDLDNCKNEGPILYEERIRAEKYYRFQVGGPQGNTVNDPVIAESEQLPASAVQTEVINPITLDPNIILANFRSYREEGPLPPVPPRAVMPQFGSLDSAIVPFSSSEPNYPTNANQPSDEGVMSFASGPQNSILGVVPKPALPSGQAIGSSCGVVPTYYNPLVPNSDLFYPPSQRCLFGNDHTHHAFSTSTKAISTSPPDLSPITSVTALLSSPVLDKDGNNTNKNSTETRAPSGKIQQLMTEGGDQKSKSAVIAKGKRNWAEGTSKSIDTPRPKRGRPSTANKNGAGGN